MTLPPRSSTTPHALLLAALASAQLLIGLDYNIVFVALPDIASLGFSGDTLQWVVSAYAIAFGGLLLLCGRLTDTVGPRRIFFLGLALFAAGSLTGTLAVTDWMLIAGRGIQGAGGAALAPSTLALLSGGFPEGVARNRALGLWGAAGSAGMVLGSILGGVLTDAFGWRAVFLVNLPLVVAIMTIALRALPTDSSTSTTRGLDWRGAILTTATAGLLVLGFTLASERGWSASATVLTLLTSLIASIALLCAELRHPRPLLDLRLLHQRHLAVGTGSTFLFMAGFGATAYFLTLYFQQTRGLSPLLTGLAFVAPCAGVLAGTNLGGRLASGLGLRATLVVGNVIGLAGVASLTVSVGATTPWPAVLALAVCFSLGQGIVFTAMFATAITGTPASAQGAASGIATTGQQLGGAIGLAVLINLTSTHTQAAPTAAMAGIAAIILAAIAVALLLPSARLAGAGNGR